MEGQQTECCVKGAFRRSRSQHPDCKIEQKVNKALADSMQQAEALLIQRFGEVTLDQLRPEQSP